MTGTRPREIGRLWLPRQSRDSGHGGGALSARAKNANLILSVQDGVDARDQFARLYMEAERAAEAQGVTP